VFLLDTDVLSSLRRAKPHPLVRAWIAEADPAALSTSVITVTEIQCGIERQRPGNPAYAEATQAWLDRLLQLGDMRVLPLEVEAAQLLGRMHETPALRNFVLPSPGQKRPKTAADLAVAAIAIACGAAIATGNHAHFAAIDACFRLPGLYDPFRNEWLRERPA
jgi:hypothetical protein